MANLTITESNVLISGLTNEILGGTDPSITPFMGVAGVDLTSFMPVYLDSADLKYKKAGAASTSAVSTAVAMTLCAAKAGQPVVLIAGDTLGSVVIGLGAILTVGESYVVSATAGLVCPKSDLASTQWITELGIAETTSNFRLDINARLIQKP